MVVLPKDLGKNMVSVRIFTQLYSTCPRILRNGNWEAVFVALEGLTRLGFA